jgi:hypothetical protein
MEEHYTGCQHFAPFVLNNPYAVFLVIRKTLLTLVWPLLHEFHHQQSFPVPENSCHQLYG